MTKPGKTAGSRYILNPVMMVRFSQKRPFFSMKKQRFKYSCGGIFPMFFEGVES